MGFNAQLEASPLVASSAPSVATSKGGNEDCTQTENTYDAASIASIKSKCHSSINFCVSSNAGSAPPVECRCTVRRPDDEPETIDSAIVESSKLSGEACCLSSSQCESKTLPRQTVRTESLSAEIDRLAETPSLAVSGQAGQTAVLKAADTSVSKPPSECGTKCCGSTSSATQLPSPVFDAPARNSTLAYDSDEAKPTTTIESVNAPLLTSEAEDPEQQGESNACLQVDKFYSFSDKNEECEFASQQFGAQAWNTSRMLRITSLLLFSFV